MDGVLADFERGVRELCGIEPIGQGSATDEQTDRLWEAVKKVPHFYLKLEPVKGAAKLFNEVRAKFKLPDSHRNPKASARNRKRGR